mgnify:CR=1 FL=1
MEPRADLSLGSEGVEMAPPCGTPRHLTGPELPRELGPWILVVAYGIHLGDIDSGTVETRAKGRHREGWVVLDPREAFLLHRGHEPPVREEGAGGLVVVRREADDDHGIVPESHFPSAISEWIRFLQSRAAA